MTKLRLQVLAFVAYTLSSTIIFAQKTAVVLPAMNVIYIGLHNPVKIAVEGYKNSDVVIQISGADLIEKEGKHYLLAKKWGNATLIVGVKKKKDTLWLDTIKFRVRKIPYPEPFLGTLSNGDEQSIGTIRANATRVYASLGEGFAFEGVKLTIARFVITVIDSMSYTSIKTEGSKLTEPSLQAISKLKGNGKLYIGDIEYYSVSEGDTIVPLTKLPNTICITAKPTFPTFFSDSQRQAYITPLPTYTINGGFFGTNQRMSAVNGKINSSDLFDLAGKTKHGFWEYTTGLCNPKPFKQEYYDSGKLTRYIGYDSTGYKAVEVDFSTNKDSVYYKETYPNGNTKREGWVRQKDSMYRYQGFANTMEPGEIKPYTDFYRNLQFIPIGKWKEFYPDGKMKIVGYFNKVDDFAVGCYFKGAGPDLRGYCIVLDGDWFFYNKNGELDKKYTFQKGNIVWD